MAEEKQDKKKGAIGRNKSEKAKESEVILMHAPEKKKELGKEASKVPEPKQELPKEQEKKESKKEKENTEPETQKLTLGDLADLNKNDLNLGRLFLGITVVFLIIFFISERLGFLGSVDVGFLSFWPLILIFVALLLFKVKTSRTRLFGSIAVIIIFLLSIGILFKGGNVVQPVLALEEVEEIRETTDFDAVILNGVADVEVVIGDEKSVTITGDQNMLNEIATYVVNDALVIGYTRSFWSLFLFDESSVKVEITIPELNRVSIGGVGSITAVGITAEDFETAISGEGSVELQGGAVRSLVSISGAGEYNGVEFDSVEVGVRITGDGDVHVSASETLDISIPGNGTVMYTGTPEIIERIISANATTTALISE